MHQIARNLVLAGLFALLLPWPSAPAAEPTEGERLFALSVEPILREKCLACHGKNPEAIESGFDLRGPDTALAGGDAFGDAVIVPGDAEASFLMAMIRREEPGYEMPPKEAEALAEPQVWAVRDWINAGADWPDKERVAEIYEQHAAGVTVETSGGLSEAWTTRKYKPEDVWCWQPLWQPGEDASYDVDFFIDAQLQERGIEPAPPADRRTLIRRATFDLHGLPPTPAEVEAFVNDPADDRAALARLVDRLLESPRYGERWARHWLDVVRYADSSGFANDYERPNAWRYRDYVIRAFNKDKPYNEFIFEQLAGDELAELKNDDEQSAADGVPQGTLDEPISELLIAAGFLRMGPWEHTGMSVAKVTRQQFLDDITDSVGQVFLGHALQCARCHDHKFDPIPTRDYYSLQAVFATTQFAERDAPWLESENVDGMEADRRYHRLRHEANEAALQRLTEKKQAADRAWFKERGLPYETRQEAVAAGEPEENIPPTHHLMTPEDFGQERIGRKWKNRFSWELDRYKPIAFSVYSGKTRYPRNVYGRITMPEDPANEGKLEQTAILTGGDVFSPGEPVEPAVLSAAAGASQLNLPASIDGRRLALARWIASPDNPLSTRVIANRIWHYHFGRGVAANPNNFGATGKKPTHPRLLDWLAVQLVENDWSIKHLHRLIMNSEAYRRSSSHPAHQQLMEKDPSGSSYAVFHPRRLTAEELRDAMLAVSGELNLEMGGIPVRPDMNMEAALQPRMIMGTFAPAYVPNASPERRNRRSIYAIHVRGQRDPFMETFNQPGSETSCEMRDASNVTPQVFTLMNGTEANDRALAVAVRVLEQAEDDAAAVKRLFRLAFSRDPTAHELDAALEHWDKMAERHGQLEPTPREFPTEIERRAIDENTGEPFTFTEPLFEYEDYEPDLQPHQVDADTRGLADLCLAILNANEFIYVY